MLDFTHEDVERLWNSIVHYVPERQKLDMAIDFIKSLEDIGVEHDARETQNVHRVDASEEPAWVHRKERVRKRLHDAVNLLGLERHSELAAVHSKSLLERLPSEGKCEGKRRERLHVFLVGLAQPVTQPRLIDPWSAFRFEKRRSTAKSCELPKRCCKRRAVARHGQGLALCPVLRVPIKNAGRCDVPPQHSFSRGTPK